MTRRHRHRGAGRPGRVRRRRLQQAAHRGRRRRGGAGRHRRPAHPARRPDPQPGQHGEGVRRAREVGLRGGHPRTGRPAGSGAGRRRPRQGRRRRRHAGRAGQPQRGRGELPRPPGQRELPRPPAPARRHREPAVLRPAVLQRRRREAEHPGAHAALAAVHRHRRGQQREFYEAPTGQDQRPPSRFEAQQPPDVRRPALGPVAPVLDLVARQHVHAAGARTCHAAD